MEEPCELRDAERSKCVAIPLEEDDSTEYSTPYLPSRFLCPSNLGALLESTTVSIVSGGWKETKEEQLPISPSCDVGRVQHDGRTVAVSDTGGGDTVKDDSTSHIASGEQLSNSSEKLDLGSNHGEQVESPVREDAIPSDIDHLNVPQLIPPASVHSYTITPPLPHISPLSVPRATVGEFPKQCCNSDVDLYRHHQLCIAIDEDNPVKYVPSLCRNQSCGSQRSSICNEGDISSLVRHEYKTHSRNVSETPSLPPFHSSSTSSAYHSRNSSLGSQLSSCFESDNMSNQFTDIDSVHTGSHSDLIRKQDSRFSEGSPSSYSSELSLHQHMSKPLDRKEAILKMAPMNLEDTLRNLSQENHDKCKKNISMKSSEWIKHQLECHRDSVVLVKVSSKTKHVVHFNVKAGDVIIWEFATKKKDIAFGVFFEATEVATEQFPIPDSHGSLNRKMSSILPIFRVGTDAHPIVGGHTAALDGIYEIIFDNTYSRFFAKELYYRIITQPSQPNANYFLQ